MRTGGYAEPARWVLPDEPAPIRLMNTVWADRHGVHDELAAPEGLAAWLVETGLLTRSGRGRGIAPTESELTSGRSLRDALRRLAAAVTDDDRLRARTGLDEDDAVRLLNEALRVQEPLRLAREGDGWRLTRPAATCVEQALSRVAELGATVLVGDAGSIRACYAPGCVLYFVKDHPRREWCSTACGNRVRAARHYARQRRA